MFANECLKNDQFVLTILLPGYIYHTESNFGTTDWGTYSFAQVVPYLFIDSSNSLFTIKIVMTEQLSGCQQYVIDYGVFNCWQT